MVKIESKPTGRLSYKVKNVYVVADDFEEKFIALATAYLINEGIKKAVVKIEDSYYLISIHNDKVRVENLDIGDEDIESFISAIEMNERIFLIREPNFENWEKIFSQKSKRKLFFYGAMVAVAFIVVSLAIYQKKSMQEVKKTQPQGTRIITLSPHERKLLVAQVSVAILAKFMEEVNSLPRGERLRSFQAEIKTEQVQVNPDTIKEVIYGTVSVVHESIYPINGSRKSGEYFIRSKTYKINPQPIGKAFLSSKLCGITLLRKGIDLIVPDENRFRGVVKEWNHIKHIIEKLYMCNFHLVSLSISQVGLSLEVILNEDQKE